MFFCWIVARRRRAALSGARPANPDNWRLKSRGVWRRVETQFLEPKKYQEIK
jgi:hypothetical protein